jgi:large subunit ribosomal protein L7/L12
MSERIWTPEVADIGNRIVALSLTRAAELYEYLERVHGVRVSLAAGPVECVTWKGDPVPPSCHVRLEGYEPAKKISVIKEVRELTGWGLRESKDFVERSPAVLKAGLAPDEAATMRSRLEAAGAKVTVGFVGVDRLDVRLDSFDRTKIIPVIKVVREVTGVGLAEAKRLVECAPSVVKSAVTREEAEAIKARVEAAGGKVSLGW